MSLKKLGFIVPGFSFFLGGWSILLGWFLIPQGTGGGYGLLLVDDVHRDRDIGGFLQEAGLNRYISESTQWVFWDDFGELTRIPLDEYPERVESFDPRNDGYADLLYRFFVRDGKRRFYIPVDQGLSVREIERRLARAGLPSYSFEPPITRSLLGLFMLFAIGATGALLLSPALLPAVALIPLTASFVFAGPPGLALGGILFALLGVLIVPLREFFAFRLRGLAIQREGFKRFWIMALVFILIYLGIGYGGSIPLVLSVLGLFSFFSILFSSLLVESLMDKGQDARFPLVPMYGGLLRPILFPWSLVPFALVSLAALLTPFFPGRPVYRNIGESLQDVPIPNAAAYWQHLAFQSSFSQRPLRPSGGPLDDPWEGYYHYYLGDDGLIAGIEELPYELIEEKLVSPSDSPEEVFSFPLQDLTDFLNRTDGSQGYVASAGISPGDLISVFMVLALAIPALIRLKKNQKRMQGYLEYNSKQVAA